MGGAVAPESRGSFGGFIGPKNLVALVENAAPWLFDGSHPASVLGTGRRSAGALGPRCLAGQAAPARCRFARACELPAGKRRHVYGSRRGTMRRPGADAIL